MFLKQVRRLARGACLALAASAVAVPSAHSQLTVLTALPGQNVAQQKMGQSIDNFCPTVSMIAKAPTATSGQQDLAALCTAMVENGEQPGIGGFGLDANGLNGALQQLNGGAELVVPTSQASVLQTTQTSRQTGVIEARLNELRNWTTGTVLASTEPPGAAQIAALSPLELGGAIHLAQNEVPPFAYSAGPLGLFADGLGQFGSRDMTTSQNGYSFNYAGFIAGADYRFTPQLIAGLAFGYTQSNTNFDTSAVSAPGQFLHGNLFQGSLYTTYAVTDALYLNGIGYVGGGNNNSQRQIVLPNTVPGLPGDRTATGSFGSQIQGVTLEGGYAVPFDPLVVTPIARFLYQHTGVDAFSEEGALGADLQYGNSSVNTVISFLGADAQYATTTPLGALYPIARFRWAHQYSPGNTAVSVAYSNDPTQLSSFILPANSTTRNYFDLGVGVTLQVTASSSAYVSYDSILGLNHTTYNAFTAGVRMNF
jgi:outer membrane autotransporter protein